MEHLELLKESFDHGCVSALGLFSGSRSGEIEEDEFYLKVSNYVCSTDCMASLKHWIHRYSHEQPHSHGHRHHYELTPSLTKTVVLLPLIDEMLSKGCPEDIRHRISRLVERIRALNSQTAITLEEINELSRFAQFLSLPYQLTERDAIFLTTLLNWEGDSKLIDRGCRHTSITTRSSHLL